LHSDRLHACLARFHRLWRTLADLGISYHERLPYLPTYVVRRSRSPTDVALWGYEKTV